jgi:thiol-disulfide isomerase/thioredoxin
MIMRYLGLALLIQILSFSQASGQAPPPPADVIRSSIKAVEKLESVEYEVRREYVTTDGRKFKGRTNIVAARSPLRFSAKLEGEDVSVTQLAVSDGKVIRSSQNGKTSASEGPVFTSRILQGSLNDAHRDVTTTLRLLFDREFLQTALASQNIMFAGQDEIEGDTCNIVLYVRASNEGGNASDYFWISTQTGLPRASQRLLMVRGQSSLHPRFIISNIKLNPVIPPETFLYEPKASDSSSATEPKNAPPPAAEKNLTGTLLPDLELRDIDYKPVKMIDLKGERTLISFWAPWCSPCIAEFAVLKKLQEEYKGKLKIIAVAVQDSRLNVVEFIKKNPGYKFTFLSDPELPDGQSKVSEYFKLSVLPTSVFVDSQGKVIDRWAGFENEAQLVKKIQQLMER